MPNLYFKKLNWIRKNLKLGEISIGFILHGCHGDNRFYGDRPIAQECHAANCLFYDN